MKLAKILLLLSLSLYPASLIQAQEKADTPNAEVIRHPDGSMTIIGYGVDENGQEIKRVTTIKVTEYPDGSKLVIKTVTIYELQNKSEVMSKSFTQTSMIRPNRGSYRVPTNDRTRLPPASPDGT